MPESFRAVAALHCAHETCKVDAPGVTRLPMQLFEVHAIASGMDAMLYPAMRDSDVVLTGEKGLVGGHLADTGFG